MCKSLVHKRDLLAGQTLKKNHKHCSSILWNDIVVCFQFSDDKRRLNEKWISSWKWIVSELDSFVSKFHHNGLKWHKTWKIYSRWKKNSWWNKLWGYNRTFSQHFVLKFGACRSKRQCRSRQQSVLDSCTVLYSATLFHPPYTLLYSQSRVPEFYLFLEYTRGRVPEYMF